MSLPWVLANNKSPCPYQESRNLIAEIQKSLQQKLQRKYRNNNYRNTHYTHRDIQITWLLKYKFKNLWFKGDILNYEWSLNYVWTLNHGWTLNFGWTLNHGWTLNYGWTLNHGWTWNHGLNFKLRVNFEIRVRGQKDRQTDTDINTMTRPGLGARPREIQF